MTTRRQLLRMGAVGLANAGLLRPRMAHAATAEPWRLALPGYLYEFPRDHMAHPEFQTEWWYFTGHLGAEKPGGPQPGELGFELTFFRQGRQAPEGGNATWQSGQFYLAHFALSDASNQQFRHWERLNRPGPGLAGADATHGRVWNGNWSAVLQGEHDWRIQAVEAGHAIDLQLRSHKPPVLHGKDGVHQKAAGDGRASHYISLTRMHAEGSYRFGGREQKVSGYSWMDHEFFTSQLNEDQVGWDWFSIQLDNNSELMLYRLRRRDGSIEPLSGGTWVRPDGSWEALRLADISLEPQKFWTSKRTGARYPIGWQIRIPRLELSLAAATRIDDQELTSERKLGPSYWEGLMSYRGTLRGEPVLGGGYLELTGYAEDVNLSGETRGGMSR
jgi:predicted secreted hydrolase